MGNSKKPLTTPLNPRDLTFMKPKGHEKWLTITELSIATGKDISWLRRLERANRIPVAKRFPMGELTVRLWSPAQVKEITAILKTLKRGRPKKS